MTLTTKQIDAVYVDHADILVYRSHWIAGFTCLDYFEAFSKANEIFMAVVGPLEAIPDDIRPILCKQIKHRLLDYSRKEGWYTHDPEAFDDLTYNELPSAAMEFDELCEQLSTEAQNVVRLILGYDEGDGILDGTEPPRIARGKLRRFLRAKAGVSMRCEWGVMRELQGVFS